MRRNGSDRKLAAVDLHTIEDCRAKKCNLRERFAGDDYLQRFFRVLCDGGKSLLFKFGRRLFIR
jgi:hypothetical protein